VRRLLVFASTIVLVETVFFAALTPLLPAFRDELGLVKWETGLLVATYAIGGVAGAVPAGMLATRFGVKWTVIAGLLVLSATSALFGVADAYWSLVLTRLAQGFAGTFCWTGALAWVVRATTSERRGEMIGFVMSAAIGGALLGPLVGGVASEVGRTACFGGVAAVAFVLAVWALFRSSGAGRIATAGCCRCASGCSRASQRRLLFPGSASAGRSRLASCWRASPSASSGRRLWRCSRTASRRPKSSTASASRS